MIAAIALLAAACAATPAVTQEAQGGAWIAFYGDYVGKRIVLVVDGRTLEDRRFTFPPPGAIDRFGVESGPARTVRAEIRIDGCPDVWTGDLAVAPGRDTDLIFEGCRVTAHPPAAR